MLLALTTVDVSGGASAGKGEKGPGGSETTPEAPPAPQWRVISDRGQIEGYADGSRVIQREDVREVEEANRPATLTMADGSQFQATPEVRVIPVEMRARPAGSVPRISEAAASIRHDGTPVNRPVAVVARADKIAGSGAAGEEVKGSAGLARWGGMTLTMGLRVFCVVLFLRLVFSWIEVSYSYAAVTRFALVFVVIGEAVFRAWSGSLWAG